MADPKRVSLIDPMLYQSSYINPNPVKPIKLNFWKRFNGWNFSFNVLIPILIFIFILFVLKEKYHSKKQKKDTCPKDKPLSNFDLSKLSVINTRSRFLQ